MATINPEKQALSLFQRCRKIDCSDIIRKNYMGVAYISWADMWARLYEHFPDARVLFHSFENLPYLKTEAGYFVQVSVTIENAVHSEILPVMSGDMKSVLTPDARDINDNLKRCFVKACALHGLGLSVYEKDDVYAREEKKDDPKHSSFSAVKPTARSPQIPPSSKDGEYRVSFGKYQGKTLEEIGIDQATEYAHWLKKNGIHTKKPLDPKAREFIKHVEAYQTVQKMLDTPLRQEEVPPLTDEDIPF